VPHQHRLCAATVIPLTRALVTASIATPRLLAAWPTCCLTCCLRALRMRKLMHRVVFPMELKLSNTTDDADNADCTYELFAVVVHVGSGPHHGGDCCC
jgi:hypothetical protein